MKKLLEKLRWRNKKDERPVETCGNCHKERWGVDYRKYLVPKVSPIPIKSINKLCDGCFENIKTIITNINDEIIS